MKEEENNIINTDKKLAKEFLLNSNSLVKNFNPDKEELRSTNWIQKYQEIINNISDLIIEIDSRGDLTYISPQVYDITGYTSEELNGKNIFEYIKYEDISKIHNIMQNALTSKKLLTVEVNARHKDGHYIPFSVRGKIYKKGNEIRYVVILRDISEQKEAQLKLKESEEKFRLMAENTDDLIVVFNKKIQFEYVNEITHSRILGYSPDYFKKPVFRISLVHKDDLERMNLLYRNTVEKGTYKNQIRLKHENGNYLWFEVKGKTYIDGNGNKKIIFISSEITDIKNIEKRLKESEEKYRLMAENTDDLIVVFNEKFQVEYVNETTHSRILGYSPDQFKNAGFRISLIHKDDLERTNHQFKDTIEKGTYKNQIRLKHENGNYFWFEVKGKTYIDGNGDEKIIFVSREITEIKNVEEKLKELNNLKIELLRRTSHELKTPLTSICGATELLLTTYYKNLDDLTKNLIEIIKNGGDRLKKLVNDLLDVMQLESKKILLKKYPENIVKILENCINEIKLFANERCITINFNYQKDCYISIDKLRFEQVIFNILSNAIKFTPPFGEIAITIDENSGIYADILIKDTGIGFTEEEKSRLFILFGKIERYGGGQDIITEGTGLGLYISKEIVELHGGKIWVESKGRNKGSLFTIRLFKNNSILNPNLEL